MFALFFGLSVLALTPLVVANHRLNQMGPSLQLRAIVLLIIVTTVAAVVFSIALITGHAMPIQLVPGYFVAGLVELVLIEALRCRSARHGPYIRRAPVPRRRGAQQARAV